MISGWKLYMATGLALTALLLVTETIAVLLRDDLLGRRNMAAWWQCWGIWTFIASLAMVIF